MRILCGNVCDSTSVHVSCAFSLFLSFCSFVWIIYFILLFILLDAFFNERKQGRMCIWVARGMGKNLGGVGEVETIIRTHYMKKILFSKRKNGCMARNMA